MKTSDEMRLENLVGLVKKYGGVTNLTRALGRSTRDNTLNQLLNKSPSSTTGAQKHMGTKLAREIEITLALERGFMDHDHSTSESMTEIELPKNRDFELLTPEQQMTIQATMGQLVGAMIGANTNKKDK